ncbi:MAG: sigma-70 family RNA polymerase sigma factor [Bacteroidetes bacterium]|nr:sigma-70 family RNA polymerase sigma factor [Bacteroidota bacterium]
MHFAPKVFLLCRRYAIDKAEAEDFLQECFIKLFQEIKKFDPEKGAFGAWLYRLSTNTILQELRKKKRRVPLSFPERLPEPLQPDPELELISDAQLQKAVSDLPDGYRMVLNLYIFEKWSHRDIAIELGITESSSRSQLARARKLLKQLLIDQMPTHHEQRVV